MKKTLLILCAAFCLLTLQSARAATYSFRNDPFTYDTPSGTASSVTWHAGTDGSWLGSPACTSYPNGDDDWADAAFPGGFTFVYGGVTYSQVRIYSNGMLAFGNDVSGFHRDYTPQALPITTAGAPGVQGNCTLSAVPVNLMIAYWIDIVAGSARGVTLDSVKYELLGTAPNRRLVITWNNVALYTTTTTRYTFQIALFESASGVNGNFEYRYTSGASTGANATVGVQLSTTDYTQYAYNQTFIDTTNGTNIHWYPQTTPASAAGVYHFDEALWDGTAGQVLDSSGIAPAQNATSVGLANTQVATTPCGFGRAGIFPASNAAINAVVTPLTLGNTGSIDFWYSSNAKWNANNSQATLFDATTVANRPFYLMKTANGALQFTISDSAGTIRTTTSANQSFAANTWQHIGVSWNILAGTNQTYIQIFLNGALLTSARYTTTGTIASLGTLAIGDNRTFGITPSGGSPNSANGYIDEVKVYTSQINVYQVAADMSCTALIDHLLIQSASTGLTCISNPLTIVACQNTSCTVRYTAGVTGTLTGSGTNMTVNWDGATGGATGAGFAMGSSGSVVKNVQVVTQGVATSGAVTFGISSPNPVPLNSAVCNFGNNSPANNNCVFTVSKAGLIFSNSVTGGIYTIPSQVAGIATPTSVYLRALETSTGNPAVCTPALISSTTTVTMGYACNNPATCTTGDYGAINGTTIAVAGTAVSLTFDANGSAPIAVRYDDVGQITLNASVTPFAGATAMTGTSNAFVVAPHHFGFSGVPLGPMKAGNNFAPAASPFTTITAYNGRATPAVTPNFSKETTAEGVTLSFAKCQPTGGSSSAGSFSGSVGTFSNGAANASSLNWSEVGNGDLVATLASGNYLGSGLTATGNTSTSGTACQNPVGTAAAGNVGPFIPDHFDTVVTDGCTGCGFTYSAQPFTVTVTAMNGLPTPAKTLNYDATTSAPKFANDVYLTDANAAATPVGKFGVSAAPMGVSVNVAGDTLTVPKADFAYGVATLALVPTYTFSTVPTVPTTIKLGAKDSVNASVISTGFAEGVTEIRSGRIKIGNAYGSELLPLPITATVQYYNAASAWVISSTDSATQFNTNLSGAGGNVSAAIVDASHGFGAGNIGIVSPGMVTFASGRKMFSLAAPGKAGSADLSIVTAPGYLLPSSTGRATFGVYKGTNEFIYMREAY